LASRGHYPQLLRLPRTDQVADREPGRNADRRVQGRRKIMFALDSSI
jgi:hypothetical protein